MIERLTIQRVTDPRREGLCDWLRQHGGDPNDAALPGWVERDDEARQIRYQAYVLDEDGQVLLTRDNTDVEREVHVIQLEAAPLAFPLDPELKERPFALNPDCEQRKHDACAGDAWDDDLDAPTDCACPCHKDDPDERIE